MAAFEAGPGTNQSDEVDSAQARRRAWAVWALLAAPPLAFNGPTYCRAYEVLEHMVSVQVARRSRQTTVSVPSQQAIS
ncbi:hypothetical protein ACFV14_20210 [Streptomyces zaomyceticus]|uniref:hypothetical protein n=1 Tax=Streptomyces zaomyceticus TaxID=68286 RepID=UPI00368BCB1A